MAAAVNGTLEWPLGVLLLLTCFAVKMKNNAFANSEVSHYYTENQTRNIGRVLVDSYESPPTTTRTAALVVSIISLFPACIHEKAGDQNQTFLEVYQKSARPLLKGARLAVAVG